MIQIPIPKEIISTAYGMPFSTVMKILVGAPCAEAEIARLAALLLESSCWLSQRPSARMMAARSAALATGRHTQGVAPPGTTPNL
jgi:hypothetical protein